MDGQVAQLKLGPCTIAWWPDGIQSVGKGAVTRSRRISMCDVPLDIVGPLGEGIKEDVRGFLVRIAGPLSDPPETSRPPRVDPVAVS